MKATGTSVDILIGELLADEALCESFLNDPEGTLRAADEWAIPLSESELRFLQRPGYRLWDRVAEAIATETHAIA